MSGGNVATGTSQSARDVGAFVVPPRCGVCGDLADVRVEDMPATRMYRITAECDHARYSQLNQFGTRPAGLAHNIEMVEISHLWIYGQTQPRIDWPSRNAFSAGHSLTTVLDGCSFECGVYRIQSQATNSPKPTSAAAYRGLGNDQITTFSADKVYMKGAIVRLNAAGVLTASRSSADGEFVVLDARVTGLDSFATVRTYHPQLDGAAAASVTRAGGSVQPLDVLVGPIVDHASGSTVVDAGDSAVILSAYDAGGGVREMHARRVSDDHYVKFRAHGSAVYQLGEQGKD